VVLIGWPELGQPVFAISVAAELSGLSAQTLRTYEREGLVEPGRSAGGTRLYSGNDVERLREIVTLTRGGLNLAGVKLVLELQAEVRRLRSEVEHLAAGSRPRAFAAQADQVSGRPARKRPSSPLQTPWGPRTTS
jgi:DNA-binding transcriptional MerR regulator